MQFPGCDLPPGVTQAHFVLPNELYFALRADCCPYSSRLSATTVKSGEMMSFGVTVLLSFAILLLILMVGVTKKSCKLVPQDLLSFDKGGFTHELAHPVERGDKFKTVSHRFLHS